MNSSATGVKLEYVVFCRTAGAEADRSCRRREHQALEIPGLCLQNRIVTEMSDGRGAPGLRRPVPAGAAVGTHGNHPFARSSRPHESAAQAGAVQTLRDFAGVIYFENTP